MQNFDFVKRGINSKNFVYLITLIHRLIIFDQETRKGCTLYDNGKVNLNTTLLIRLIQTMALLSEELGPSKGGIKETELGSYQIGIVSKGKLSYVIIQDTYDNEPFTRKILDHVIERFHNDFINLEMNDEYGQNTEYTEEIASLLDTMKFPRQLIPNIQTLILRFQIKTHNICDTLLLTDLDDGLVHIFHEPEQKGIINLLLEILSEIPFHREWLGESSINESNSLSRASHEVWFIHRIGMTDFCITGRAYYKPESERSNLAHRIKELSENIHQLLLADTSWL